MRESHMWTGPKNGHEIHRYLDNLLVDGRENVSVTCSTRWVGVMRGRAKPWRRCLRGPCCAGGFRADFALRPGIRSGSPGFAWPSSSAIRRCNRSITACNSAMMAISTSRSTVVRSTSVSIPCI